MSSKRLAILEYYDSILQEIHSYSKQNGQHKGTRYKVPCKQCNGSNTVVIDKKKQIGQMCRKCTLIYKTKPRNQWQNLIWIFNTSIIEETDKKVENAYRDFFVLEEKALNETGCYSFRHKVFCSNGDCHNLINYVTNKTNRCADCADKEKKLRPYERLFNQKIKRPKRIKKNGVIVQFLLSYEELTALCDITNCHYCNKSLNRAKYKSEEGSTGLLLDRKDSNLSYTKDNCVPCCPVCNDTKGEHLSYEEMIMLMKFRGVFKES